MTNTLEKTQIQMKASLEDTLKTASAIITKDYLDKLESFELVTPSEEDLDIDVSTCGKLFKLTKLVLNKEENFLEKLTTIVNVAFSIDCSLATIIRSNGDCIDFYFGIVSKNYRDDRSNSKKRRSADVTAFKGALMGNLVGADIDEVTEEEVSAFCNDMIRDPRNCIASVSGIVALRNDESNNIETYVQGIENLVDSCRGQKYTILMFADPISTTELRIVKRGYELLHTQLSTLLKSTVTLNESDTTSLSKARTNGITEGITNGISLTQSRAKTKGWNLNASVGINFVVSANVSGGINRSTSETTSEGKTQSQSTQRSSQLSETVQSGISTGKSLQINYENRSVKSLLDLIDKNLERLDSCESFGAFDSAAYVIADSREDALSVASNYNALMRGKESNVQASHINTWYKPEETRKIGRYLSAFTHPKFYADKESKVLVTPASIISGNELAIQVGLPKKSINGITVIPMVAFGRNVKINYADGLTLGNLYHMGRDDGGKNPSKVSIDIQSLSMHTFVTGSTGSGKSNTLYELLRKLRNNGVNFMVVEPAKGEYKNVFGNYPHVSVFGTNPAYSELLRINPFRFPRGVHVLEHIDRLVEIFNVCWPMYAAMPAVLKEAVLQAYEVCGWDLLTSKNYVDDNLFPTFKDLLAELTDVIDNSAYDKEIKSNYKGSLETRVKSLTNGLNGQIFSTNEIDNGILFDSDVIIDLSRIGSLETKALIMGILVMRLSEHRMANADKMNVPLRHVTVLEEAHNILKRTSSEQSSEGSNVAGKSVEMLSNAIAEMRTYGEGFIIADQSPNAVDISAIRNTNTKIIMRLPDETDRRLAGKAAALTDEQLDEIAKLPKGVAVVYQNDWLEPVLCKIKKFSGSEDVYNYKPPQETENTGKESRFRLELLKLLLRARVNEPEDVDIEGLQDVLPFVDISTKNKMGIHHLISEYRKTGLIALWKDEHFERLSGLVGELMNVQNKLSRYIFEAKSFDEFDANLSAIIREQVCDVSDELCLAISQCLMKNYSLEDEKNVDIYAAWRKNVVERGRLV